MRVPFLDSDGKLPLIYLKEVDNTFRHRDSTDTSKIMQFVMSGITTGTTRSLTVPDHDGTLLLNNFAATVSGRLTFTTGPIFQDHISFINNKYIFFNDSGASGRQGIGMSAGNNLMIGDTTGITAIEFQCDAKFDTAALFKSLSYSPSTPTPSVPSAGTLKVFSDNGDQRDMLGFVNSAERAKLFQPHEGWQRTMWFQPATSITNSAVACAWSTTLGASMTQTYTNATYDGVQNTQRLILDYGGTAANVQNNLRTSHPWCGPGNAAGVGGFYAIFEFAPFPNHAAGILMFVGLSSSSAALGNTDPSNLTNAIGIGFNASSANGFLLHNDGAGAAVTVDLGSNYAESVATRIRLELWCAPNSSTVYYRVTDLNHTSVAPTTGNFSTDVPATNTALYAHFHTNTGTTGNSEPILYVYKAYVESDI
jgi:hypothetical protein